MKAFGQYVVSDEGQQASADAAKSAPIPDRFAEEARAAIDSITAGR